MGKKKTAAKLTGGGKLRKWTRMVLMLTFKKYGGRILSHLFFAYLLVELTKDMNLIWKDFSMYKNCQDNYVESISVNVSRQYTGAAHALAESVLLQAQCVAKGLDMDLPKPMPHIPIGSIPTGWLKDVFGWFSPLSLHFHVPGAELKIKSNTMEVVASVKHDFRIFTKIGFWTRLAGFILAFFSVFKILLTATCYTLRNKVWQPSLKSHVVRLSHFIRVVGAYIAASLAVFVQAYATDKFCQVSINDTVLKTPICEVWPEKCDFSCKLVTNKYSSPCEKCHVKLHWWWVEPFSTPNLLCGAYIGFMLLVMVLECSEAGFQLRQAVKKKLDEREKRRRARLRSQTKRARKLEEIPLLEESDIYYHQTAENSVSEIVEASPPPCRKHRRKKRHPVKSDSPEQLSDVYFIH